MVGDPLFDTLLLLSGTFGYCAVSGLIPLVNAELYLVAVAATTSSPPLLLLALAATAGQMVAKTSMYLAGGGVARLKVARLDEKLERWRGKVESWKHRPDPLLFASGSLGLPPLYAVSLLAGALGVGLVRFIALCGAGRYLRFALCLAFPKLLESWLL